MDDQVPFVGQRVWLDHDKRNANVKSMPEDADAKEFDSQEPVLVADSSQGIVAYLSNNGKSALVYPCDEDGLPKSDDKPIPFATAWLKQMNERDADKTMTRLIRLVESFSDTNVDLIKLFIQTCGEFDAANAEKRGLDLADKAHTIHYSRLTTAVEAVSAKMTSDASSYADEKKRTVELSRAKTRAEKLDQCLRDEWINPPSQVVYSLLGIKPSSRQVAHAVLEDELHGSMPLYPLLTGA